MVVGGGGGRYEAAVDIPLIVNRARRVRYAKAQSDLARAVRSTIPTVSLDNVARQGFFFAGGKMSASWDRTNSRRWAARCSSRPWRRKRYARRIRSP